MNSHQSRFRHAPATAGRTATKDTMLMSTLIVSGLLLVAAMPALSGDRAARLVADSARSVEQAAVTPAALRPVLQEPAIVVTAPRLRPHRAAALS